MKNLVYLIHFILFITLSFFITSCTINRLYTKDEFIALGEESDDIENKELQEAQLVNPYIGENGLYHFSSTNIRKSNGELMFEGIDFNYNDDLNGIGLYDTGNSGSLTIGYFRVVHNGDNVLSGLGLTPRAIDLTNPVTPPEDEIYIDPEKSIFVLPRPFYWSRCEDVDNLTEDSEIGNGQQSLLDYNPSYIILVTDKFNNNGIEFTYPGISGMTLYPLGDSLNCPDKLTLSMWVRLQNDSSRYPIINIYIGQHRIQLESSNGSPNHLIYIDGNGNVDTDTTNIGIDWNHIYIVADKNKGLDSNSKSIRVFINGDEKMSYNSSYNISDSLSIWFGAEGVAQCHGFLIILKYGII